MNSKVFIRLKDKGTGLESQEVAIENIIFEQSEIEFDFWNDDKTECNTLPYNDFLFYKDDYEVIVRIEAK